MNEKRMKQIRQEARAATIDQPYRKYHVINPSKDRRHCGTIALLNCTRKAIKELKKA